MSVINQMLRDLDGRGKPMVSGSGQGVQSVALPPQVPVRHVRRHRMTQIVTLALVVFGAVVLIWQWRSRAQVPSVTQPMPSVRVSPATLPEVAASDAAPPLAEKADLRVSNSELSLRMEGALDAASTLPTASKATMPVQEPIVAKAPSAAPSNNMKSVPVEPKKPEHPPDAKSAPPALAPRAEASVTAGAPVVATKASVVTVEDRVTAAQRQVAAVQDTLTQAQALWGLGNQSGAVDLLRDAMQSAEKSVQQPGMETMLVALVRELARMQMAMGRVAEAHDVLVHFESRLKAIPEIWAMRANAAQRLGQHQDSVQSYMQALQARPNEQRWLLGLAVSLAAMGQTASASEVVERAQAQGTINRDIAVYLRQMGVNIK